MYDGTSSHMLSRSIEQGSSIIKYCVYNNFFNGYAPPPGGSEWIISIGDYVDNSFTSVGSSDSREVMLELLLGFVFHFLFV